MEISIEFIKNLGWHKYNDTYIKVPYPFSLTWDNSKSSFKIKDLFFPDLIESDVFLKTQTDYYNATNPVVIATKSVTPTEMDDFRNESLFLSYKNAVESLIRKIPSWDSTIRTNQVNLFISQTLAKKFYIKEINLDIFLTQPLKVNQENRSFELLKARLDEKDNAKIKEELNSIMIKTMEYYYSINKL